MFVVTEGGGGGALPRTTPVKRAVPSRILAYLLASLIAAVGIAVAIWLDDVTGTTLFMSMLLSVVVSVWLFGPGPGWSRSSSPAQPVRSSSSRGRVPATHPEQRLP